MLGKILDGVVKAFGAVGLGGSGDPKLAALDRGVLEVALMVSALDGEILPAEYAAFESLGRKCRGFTDANARNVLDKALQKAGYLVAIAQVGVYTPEERVQAFVERAAEALPAGFECGSRTDMRRAFALWVAMGAADGTFSDIERRAVESLAGLFADLSLASSAVVFNQLGPHAPGIRLAGVADGAPPMPSLLEPDFFDKALRIVRDLATPELAEKAEAEFEALVGAD